MQSDAPAKPDSKPSLGRWFFIILVLIAIGLVYGLVPRFQKKASLVLENQDLSTSTVQVTNALPGIASASLVLPAEIHAFQETPIYARASGFLKHWNADIGATVKAGDALADIDSPEVNEQLTQATAELAQSQAAESLARITAARWSELLKTSSVSEQENAEKQADLKLKTANVDAAKANVHRLEDLTSFTHVTAPFTGTVTARNVDNGDLITSGKELFKLADITKLRVYVRVPQTAAPNMAIGLKASLIVPEKSGKKFPARIVRTSGAIDAGSRTLLTELEVDNPDNEILAGSYAQVGFEDVKQNPTLVLPANTLLFRAEGLQVGIVGADGKVELRSIILGRDLGKTVEIISGVNPSDKIIMNPADSITSGATVRIATETAVAAPDKSK